MGKGKNRIERGRCFDFETQIWEGLNNEYEPSVYGRVSSEDNKRDHSR